MASEQVLWRRGPLAARECLDGRTGEVVGVMLEVDLGGGDICRLASVSDHTGASLSDFVAPVANQLEFARRKDAELEGYTYDPRFWYDLYSSGEDARYFEKRAALDRAMRACAIFQDALVEGR
jgi:hypothetical protein